MSEHELEKLLGGFAADTLTPEEREKLFTAALQDQQLFNALADEQALKELLADPAVRRKLLHALNQTMSTGGSSSWLDWLQRPATIAYAGGLAAAVFAIVLGTKVYQDSVRQAAQSATEDTKPITPPPPAAPASEPAQAPLTDTELKANEKVAPAAEPKKKDGLNDKLAKREKAAAPQSQEQRLSSSARDDMRRRSKQDEAPKQVEAPVSALGKSAEDATASANKPTAATEPTTMEAIAPATGAVAAAVSARTLFYAEASARSDVGTMAHEREARKSGAEPSPEVNRPEYERDRFALRGTAADISAPVKPLGLRYSFVVHEADGRDREVDATTAAKIPEPVYLTVETNQDAYIQIWKRAGGATPQLVLPEKETSQISHRIAAGQRQRMALPTESEMVTVRLSRMPFGPITRQEAVMLGRGSPSQIQETVKTGSPSTKDEQATYVVNQDPSPTAQIAVDIPIDR